MTLNEGRISTRKISRQPENDMADRSANDDDMDDDISLPPNETTARATPVMPKELWRRSHLPWLGTFEDHAEPKRWLVDGIFGIGEVVVIHGPEKVGKTQLAVDLAAAVAEGRPWFGRNVLSGGAVYIAGEKPKITRKRFHATQKCRGLGELPIIVRPGVNLGAKSEVDAIITDAATMRSESGFPVRLIVVDTLNRCAPGVDENNAGAMAVILNALTRIAVETRATIVVLHHNSRGSDTARGSTAITSAGEAVMGVSRVGDDRIATLDLANDAAAGVELRFRLRSVELFSAGEHGKAETAVVLEPITEASDATSEYPVFEAGRASGSPDQRRATEVVKVFHELGAGGQLDRRELLRVCRQRQVVSSDNERSGREMLRRALLVLRSDGALDYDEANVWPANSAQGPTARGGSKDPRALALPVGANGGANKPAIGPIGPIGPNEAPIGPSEAEQ